MSDLAGAENKPGVYMIECAYGKGKYVGSSVRVRKRLNAGWGIERAIQAPVAKKRRKA